MDDLMQAFDALDSAAKAMLTATPVQMTEAACWLDICRERMRAV